MANNKVNPKAASKNATPKNATPNTTAAPGTTDEAGKKKREPKRKDHPAVAEILKQKDGLVSELPKDYDFDKHAPIKRKSWKDEADYFEYKALESEHKAAGFRKSAAECKAAGSTKDRAKAKRLVKMADKFAELRAQLEATGVDVDALLTAANTVE